MAENLRILIVDDNLEDAEARLCTRLRRSGFTLAWERVDTEAAYLERLGDRLDLIVSDFNLPDFSGLRALELLKKSGLDLPFIIVSGTIGEDMAVETMRLGATDYLLKDRLARLGVAVTRVVSQGQLRRERRQAEAVLRESNRRFHEMLENVSLIAMTLDAQGRVTFSHDFLLRLTGMDPRGGHRAILDGTSSSRTGDAAGRRAAFSDGIKGGNDPAPLPQSPSGRSGAS